MYPSSNTTRCPVRLVHKYLNLCPDYSQKPNCYLQSLQKPKIKTWNAGQVVGTRVWVKKIKMLFSDSRMEVYFTGLSLRKSSMTRLTQAGVDRKLIKEMSGHRSDAVDCYAITGDEQRKDLNPILKEKPSTASVDEAPKEQSNIEDHDCGSVG